MSKYPRTRGGICFVAPKAGALLGSDEFTKGGGAEVQQVVIGRALAARGFPTSFVVDGEGTPAGKTSEGIEVIPISDRLGGGSFRSLWKALAEADADVYYQRGNGAETAYVGLWCRLNRRRFIFGAASDSNFDPALPDLRRRRERWLYRLGQRLAHHVVCQTQRQHERCREQLGPHCSVIPSAVAPLARSPRPGTGPAIDVLWIGRLVPKKRPEWLIELAETLPERHFAMLADTTNRNDFTESLLKRARRCPNLTIVGRVGRTEIDGWYRRGRLLLCTSVQEGFPNVFLEAWARGIPTVSTVEPDRVISEQGLGGIGVNVPALRDQLHALLDDEALYRACAQASRRYCRERHALDAVAAEYESLLAPWCARRKEVVIS